MIAGDITNGIVEFDDLLEFFGNATGLELVDENLIERRCTALRSAIEAEHCGLVVAFQIEVDAVMHPPIAGGGFWRAEQSFALD